MKFESLISCDNIEFNQTTMISIGLVDDKTEAIKITMKFIWLHYNDNEAYCTTMMSIRFNKNDNEVNRKKRRFNVDVVWNKLWLCWNISNDTTIKWGNFSPGYVDQIGYNVPWMVQKRQYIYISKLIKLILFYHLFPTDCESPTQYGWSPYFICMSDRLRGQQFKHIWWSNCSTTARNWLIHI